mmetsp:Transcript_18557/g.35016  ORF Transcript_18557/g.35016 Transcript_18557/m.35016 type:complete len:148 (-) Transcript_18557:85-528(-)
MTRSISEADNTRIVVHNARPQQQQQQQQRNQSDTPEGERRFDAKGMKYSTWKTLVKKTQKSDECVGAKFGNQLRMIKGNSADKVSSVLSKYPTSASLVQAYERCQDEEEECALLAGVRWGMKNKLLGNAQSTRIRHFFRQPYAYDDD